MTDQRSPSSAAEEARLTPTPARRAGTRSRSRASVRAGAALLSLGFLGYGAPPPTPEWGLLIAEGRNYIATAWWLTTVPGLVVVAVVLSANRISAALTKGRA